LAFELSIKASGATVGGVSYVGDPHYHV